MPSCFWEHTVDIAFSCVFVLFFFFWLFGCCIITCKSVFKNLQESPNSKLRSLGCNVALTCISLVKVGADVQCRRSLEEIWWSSFLDMVNCGRFRSKGEFKQFFACGGSAAGVRGQLHSSFYRFTDPFWTNSSGYSLGSHECLEWKAFSTHIW